MKDNEKSSHRSGHYSFKGNAHGKNTLSGAKNNMVSFPFYYCVRERGEREERGERARREREEREK